jgi:hypothetical protein
MIIHCRKKPIAVEAVEWDGTNHFECMDFCRAIAMETYRANGTLTIPTLEGKMLAMTGDFIIKGVNGEFYPCKPDIFHKTYEMIND